MPGLDQNSHLTPDPATLMPLTDGQLCSWKGIEGWQGRTAEPGRWEGVEEAAGRKWKGHEESKYPFPLAMSPGQTGVPGAL